jgi:hypothetical protein
LALPNERLRVPAAKRRGAGVVDRTVGRSADALHRSMQGGHSDASRIDASGEQVSSSRQEKPFQRPFPTIGRAVSPNSRVRYAPRVEPDSGVPEHDL